MQKSNAFPASPGRQKALTRWAIAAAVALNLVFVASALRNHRRQALSGPVGNVSVHPTEKPVSLLKYLIGKSTNEGETILDMFAGSGSMCVAAQNLKRNYIGIEVDETWYRVARKRLEEGA